MRKTKNKKIKKTANKLEESIHILNTIMQNLVTELECLKSLASLEFSGNQLQTINQLTFKFGIIQVQSFMDEFNGHFLKNLGTEELKAIMPYYKRIKKEIDRFAHIKKYRNNVLAHNYRTNNNNSVFLYGNFRIYAVPQNLKEYMFLIECLSVMCNIINQLFPDAHNNALAAVIERNDADKTPYKQMLSDQQLVDALSQLQGDLDIISSSKK